MQHRLQYRYAKRLKQRRQAKYRGLCEMRAEFGESQFSEHRAIGKIQLRIRADNRQMRVRVYPQYLLKCGRQYWPSLALPIVADKQDPFVRIILVGDLVVARDGHVATGVDARDFLRQHGVVSY